ncbi:hypothetical protein FOXG_20411 [Fusarium oxysporum f. sp. lycopersici 4287]|uniref:Uncharacterized protein n=2 Tax=Fusarium oxysporum TaxID=5507 RepID=A0A0J9VJ94_FUSO4|nr:hypothetical protein FOXG_20411 [Fusarium oxysporum f. sp. lycopersici 4287]EXK46444.1 hypothetical protein FOMG_00164 [Fusarium oxysporum f. sp. melonis 26406]KNB10831.1 hypothetical protein FOXG_20411 [Fusarium oxysporum f. sp. lycopersici 4287]
MFSLKRDIEAMLRGKAAPDVGGSSYRGMITKFWTLS